MFRTSVTPAVEYPVSLADVKAHLRVTFSADDDVITRMIGEATEYVEREQSIALCSQTWKQSLRPEEMRDGGVIPIDLRPLQSIASLKYYDTDDVLTTVLASDYYGIAGTNPPAIYPKSNGWTWALSPYHPAPIEVTFVAGFGDAADVPLMLRRGIYLLVGLAYELRSVTEPGQYFREIPYGLRSVLDLYASGSLR